jgi:PAS domain S-box-containing protein
MAIGKILKILTYTINKTSNIIKWGIRMGDIKILVVEDDSIEALDIKKTLESFGYSVPHVASKGEDAIRKAYEVMPDLVLMDIVLKGDLNGIEVAREIKKLDIPIIFLTAHSEEGMVKKAMITGPYGYIIKPYSAIELKYGIELAIYKSNTEKELKASESKYNSLFENLLNGFAYHQIIVDDENFPVDFVFLRINKAFERLIKLKRKDIIGKRITELIPDIKDTNPELIEFCGQVALTGESNVFEMYFEQFKKFYSVTAYSEEKGYFATIFEDISQRRIAEESLKESERRYRTILENVQDAYLRGDNEGRIVMASPSASRMYRFDSSQEMKGISSISLYKSPEDRQIILEKLKSEGKVENMEGEALRKDGTSFWVSMNAQYYYGENGEIKGTEAFIRDITQKKKVEKALEKSESYYRAIFNHTGTATVIIEEDTIISLANAEFEKLSGYRLEDLEGKKSWTEFVLKDDLERMREYHRLRRSDPQSAPEIYDFRFIDRERNLKYIHLEVGMIPGTKKSVASLLDITGRKTAEERINRLYRLYATLSQVNQAVVRIDNTEELFTRICQICVDYGKFKMAWMGRIDHDTGNLTPVSHYGYEEGYLEKISINIHEKPTSDKPASIVGETGELVVIEDIKNEPNLAWGPEALKRGYKSLALIPVKFRDNLIGILNIYSEEVGFFSDEEEVELVREMGMDISMAIDFIETEKDRKKMVRALHESEKNLRFSNEWLAFAQRAAKSGFWDWDMLTGKLTWSPEFYELFDLPSTAEPSFDTWLEIMHPDDREPAMDRINRAIENHEFLENEYRVIRPDGDEIWISALGTTYYDGKGRPLRMSGISLDITEQKKKESEIEFKNTLLEAQLESSIDGILVVDNNSKFILYNHRFVEMWNIPKNLLTTNDDKKIVDFALKHLKDPQSFKEKVEYLYSHESEKSRDEIELKDGKIFDRYSAPLYDSEDNYMGRMWYFHDITEKTKIQNQIRNQYHFLQHLVDTIPYPLFYKDKNYAYIGCNKAFEEFIGLAKDDIIGKTVYDISPKDLADKYHRKDEELMESGDLQAYEAPVKYADGSRHIVLFNKTTFDDADGNVAGLIGLMVDITQRIETENALKVSENKYRALFDNADDGIFLMKNDRFVECNQKALEMFGVTLDQIIGEQPHVFSPELQPDGARSKDRSFELVQKALEGHPQHFQWKHLRYDGTPFYAEVTLNRLKIEDEYLTQAIVRDITSRKKTEDLLMESEHRHRMVGQLINDFAYSCVHGESGEYEVDWITDSFYKITGYTEKELISNRCWMFTVHPEDENIAQQQLSDLNAGSTNIHIFRIITSNGEVRWLRNHVRCVEDTIPGRLRIYGAAQDITQQREYLDDLKWELEINHSLSRIYKPMISEESSMENIAISILEESKKLTGSQKGYVATIDPLNKDMVVQTHTAMMEECPVKLKDKIRFPCGVDGFYPALWGHSLNNLTGFYTNSPQTHHSSRGIPEGHIPLESFISVPVVGGGELLGQIALANSAHGYNDLDLEALERISAYYALAIQRIRYKEKIIANLNEKELLLREIHHRVKNNMQIVTSLMNLQKQYVEEDETKKVLGESQARVKSMAMVHEKLYESSDLSHINFKEYVEKLVYGIFYSYGVQRDTIKPIIVMEDFAMSMETSIPLGLIINELVSNSLRYAFPNKRTGEIKVSLKITGNDYELIVSDDGIGIPKEMDLENLKSLGLQLVTNLAHQLGAEITLDRSHGTEFRLKFKEFEYKERI